MTDYLTNDTDLTSVADAIREKGGTSEPLEWPTGYVDAVGAIETGGSGGGPYIKQYATFRNESVYLNNWEIAQALVPATPGDTVHINTFGDYILQSVTREDTGESVPFTTTDRFNYSFVMPNANVTYELYYDD